MRQDFAHVLDHRDQQLVFQRRQVDFFFTQKHEPSR